MALKFNFRRNNKAYDVIGHNIGGVLFSTEYDTGGSTTAGIQEAINALPSTGGEIYIPEGTHTLQATVLIEKNSVTLRGAGRGTLIQLANNVNGDMFYSPNTNGGSSWASLAMCNMRLDGNSANQATGHGIHSYGQNTYWRLYNLDLIAIKQHGIYSQRVGAEQFDMTHAFIAYNRIEAGDAGIRGEYGTNDVLVAYNSVAATANGIYLSGAFDKVVGNVCLANFTGGGLRDEGQVNCWVGNNTEYGAYGAMITSNRTTFNANVLAYNTNYGLYVGGGGGNTFTGNTIVGTAGPPTTGGGIYLENGSSCVVRGNYLSNILLHGIYLRAASGCIIDGNFIVPSVGNNNLYDGMFFINANGNVCQNILVANNVISHSNMRYGINLSNHAHTNITFRGNKIISFVSGRVNLGGTNILNLYPISRETFYCVNAYSVNSVLAASGNGAYSALIQPDVSRNLIAQCVNGGGGGVGTVTVTGRDQWGNTVSDTYTFAGAATFVMPKIFMSIDVNGITLSGLAGGDTISVGYGNKLGTSRQLFTGAIRKVTKIAVGDYTNYTPDVVYQGATMNDNIAAGDIFQILYYDFLE